MSAQSEAWFPSANGPLSLSDGLPFILLGVPQPAEWCLPSFACGEFVMSKEVAIHTGFSDELNHGRRYRARSIDSLKAGLQKWNKKCKHYSAFKKNLFFTFINLALVKSVSDICSRPGIKLLSSSVVKDKC